MQIQNFFSQYALGIIVGGLGGCIFALGALYAESTNLEASLLQVPEKKVVEELVVSEQGEKLKNEIQEIQEAVQVSGIQLAQTANSLENSEEITNDPRQARTGSLRITNKKDDKYNHKHSHELEEKGLLYNVHNNPLAYDYRPEDMAKFSDYGIKTTRGSGSDESMGRKIMMEPLKELVNLCEKETKRNIYVRSGFRSYALQKTTYARYGSKYSAYPGTSEHQLGMAVDIETHAYKSKEFMNTNSPVYTCFAEHAYNYGFIQSYHKHNAYGYREEPWHWRYVGKTASTNLVAQGKVKTPELLFGIKPVERAPIIVSSYIASNGYTSKAISQSAVVEKQESQEDKERKKELRRMLNKQKMEERQRIQAEKEERKKLLKAKIQS